jgi:hypothetical protein
VEDRDSGGCLLGAGGVFLLAGGLVLGAILVVGPLLDVARASRWTQTTCEVLEHELNESYADGDTLYSERVVVVHEVGGVRHRGHRVGFAPKVATNARWSFTGNLGRFPAGTSHPCWYDPGDPDDVVLDRSLWQVASLWMLFPVVLVLLGLVGTSALVHTFRAGADEPSA